MKHLCTLITEQQEEKMALESSSNHLGSTDSKIYVTWNSGRVGEVVRAKATVNPRIWLNWFPFKKLNGFGVFQAGLFGLLWSGINSNHLNSSSVPNLGGYANMLQPHNFFPSLSFSFLPPCFFPSLFLLLPTLSTFIFETLRGPMVLMRICWLEHV